MDRPSAGPGHRAAPDATEDVTAIAIRPQPRADERPALVLDRAEPAPRAAVLVLHGGRADGLGPPTAVNLPGLRMRPFTAALLRATAGQGVAVGRVRYRHRGWNGARADAARDAERALAELAAATGPVPVVLVGHSMGGRAALAAAGRPGVRGVVALAPWCPDGEPVDHLAGRDLVLLHGDRDRITDPEETWRLAARARRAGARTCALRMPGGDHPMLRDAGAWHTLTTRLVTGLLGFTPLPEQVARRLADTGPADTGPADALALTEG